jgi:hypothetical protein
LKGTGKTHTMEGNLDDATHPNAGVIPRTGTQLSLLELLKQFYQELFNYLFETMFSA